MTGHGPDLDRESARAVEALAYRLKHRDGADDEIFALEFITALRGQGWRPTLARPAPDWRRKGDSYLPDEERPGGAGYLAAKAALGFGTGPQPVVADASDDP